MQEAIYKVDINIRPSQIVTIKADDKRNSVSKIVRHYIDDNCCCYN